MNNFTIDVYKKLIIHWILLIFSSSMLCIHTCVHVSAYCIQGIDWRINTAWNLYRDISAVTLVLKMQICSKVIDISGNSVNIMQVLYLLILILSVRNGRKLHSAGWSPLGIRKTHTLTHLTYLPATSVHRTCCEPHPSTSGDTTLFWFQITLLPRVHTNSLATILPTVTSCHFQGKVSYLL